MSEYVPRVCGKCGSRRAPDATVCRHCFRPFASPVQGAASSASGAVPDQVRDAALAFADHIISGMFEGGDWPGDEVQELAIKHGLLKQETMNEPCGEDGACQCALNGAQFPGICYRKTYMAVLRTTSTDGEKGGA